MLKIAMAASILMLGIIPMLGLASASPHSGGSTINITVNCLNGTQAHKTAHGNPPVNINVNCTNSGGNGTGTRGPPGPPGPPGIPGKNGENATVTIITATATNNTNSSSPNPPPHPTPGNTIAQNMLQRQNTLSNALHTPFNQFNTKHFHCESVSMAPFGCTAHP